MGGGRSYRIATGLLERLDTEAADDDPRLRGRRRPARALRPGLGRRSTATPGPSCSPRTPSTTRTPSSRRWSGTTRSGHTCSRRPSARSTSSSPSSATGSSAPTVLAAWHASYIRRSDRARVRLAGFMTLEIADDGRIARLREWWHRRESTGRRAEAGGGYDGRRCLVRRRQRLRRAGAAQRARPGPARGPAALRLQGRDRRPEQDKDELDPRHRRRVPRRRRQGPHRVEGDPAQPVAQDLRLGQGRAGRRQQGPPGDQACGAACPTTSPRRSPS